VEFPVDDFHYVYFEGNQLTAVHARGGQNIRSNLERGRDSLQGLIPVIEEWHMKVFLPG